MLKTFPKLQFQFFIGFSMYRVFQLKTWCFEVLLWLGFWIIGLLNKLDVVLSSGNLCLNNHLKLFWPQTASDKKCQNAKLFLLNFCPNFDKIFFWFYDYMTQNMLGMAADLIPSQDLFDFTVIMQDFSSLLKSEFLSLFFNFLQKCSKKLTKRLEKPKNIVELIRKAFGQHIIYIESYRLRTKRKLIKIWTKIEQKQLWILTLFIWGCWGSEVKKVPNGWSGLNFHYSGQH